jgi:S1-C subfamily serine protease
MLEVYGKNHSRIAIGSGFIAFKRNLIVTNYHVIEGASYIVANSDDNERFAVESVVAVDEKLDIAILQLSSNASFAPLVFDTETVLKRSMRVVAIGSPAGLMNTISIGNISAFYHDSTKDWIQFTAPISSGSSGGPLLNDQGKVIGVTTATYASAQNVNMAVRATDVVNLYNHSSAYSNIAQITSAVSHEKEQANKDNDPDITIVYVTSGGKKYHLNPSCSRMRNPKQIYLLDAIQQGYEPCGICYR